MAFGNYNYNPYINPYMGGYNAPQMQMPPQAQPQNGFVWVDGIEEANNFYVAPNSAVQLWDKNLPCIYKKSADSTGKPTMQIFDLVERVPAPPVQTAGDIYVGNKDFEALAERVSKLEKMLERKVENE